MSAMQFRLNRPVSLRRVETDCVYTGWNQFQRALLRILDQNILYQQVLDDPMRADFKSAVRAVRGPVP